MRTVMLNETPTDWVAPKVRSNLLIQSVEQRTSNLALRSEISVCFTAKEADGLNVSLPDGCVALAATT